MVDTGDQLARKLSDYFIQLSKFQKKLYANMRVLKYLQDSYKYLGSNGIKVAGELDTKLDKLRAGFESSPQLLKEAAERVSLPSEKTKPSTKKVLDQLNKIKPLRDQLAKDLRTYRANLGRIRKGALECMQETAKSEYTPPTYHEKSLQKKINDSIDAGLTIVTLGLMIWKRLKNEKM